MPAALWARLRAELRALRHESGNRPERVHELHRLMRQHRYETEAWHRLRGRGHREPGGRMREFERALGEWRDLTLFRFWVREEREASSRPSEVRWSSDLLGWVRLEERRARLRALELAGRIPPSRRTGPAVRSHPALGDPDPWGRELRQRRSALRVAHRRARVRLSTKRAHELRKELRRFGFLLEMTHPAASDGPVLYPARVRRLLADLGQLHDLDRARDHLRRAPAGTPRRRWLRRLRKSRRALEPRVRRALRSRAVRQFGRPSARPAPRRGRRPAG